MLYQLSYSRLNMCFGGGGRRIRTSVGVRRQIYSLLPLAARASLHLNVKRALPHGVDGAGDRTRTRNLLITNQLLYQLSHASVTPSYEAPTDGHNRCPLGGRRLLHVPPEGVKRTIRTSSIARRDPLWDGEGAEFGHSFIEEARYLLGRPQ